LKYWSFCICINHLNLRSLCEAPLRNLCLVDDRFVLLTLYHAYFWWYHVNRSLCGFLINVHHLAWDRLLLGLGSRLWFKNWLFICLLCLCGFLWFSIILFHRYVTAFFYSVPSTFGWVWFSPCSVLCSFPVDIASDKDEAPYILLNLFISRLQNMFMCSIIIKSNSLQKLTESKTNFISYLIYRVQMESKLKTGTSLVVDRYSYSGVAFSSAKGLDFEWCKVFHSTLDMFIGFYLCCCEKPANISCRLQRGAW